MNGFKSVFASGGVWTAIFGLAAAVLIALDVLPESFDTEGAYAAILALFSLLGGFFRVKATEQVAIDPAAAANKARRNY